MRRSALPVGFVVLVVLFAVRPIMSQPIGPRGALLLSWPGFVGPGPGGRCAGVTTGWSYYGLPNGPSTAVTDYRVGVWNWGWAGVPTAHGHLWSKALGCYGPPVPSYTPVPTSIGGSDARKHFMTPPHFGYGLNALDYRSAFPRLATPSVDAKPTSASASTAGGCCRVGVKVPHADAELWVNKAKTATTGTDRVFESPELADGKEFKYELVAKWTRNGEPVTESRSVVVAGGQSVLVDFTK
jgi:uncharacterized protein (TIGR03000 family)